MVSPEVFLNIEKTIITEVAETRRSKALPPQQEGLARLPWGLFCAAPLIGFYVWNSTPEQVELFPTFISYTVRRKTFKYPDGFVKGRLKGWQVRNRPTTRPAEVLLFHY